MNETTGIKSVVRRIIIVYLTEHGDKMDQAERIADQYLEQLEQQIITEASG